MRTIIIPLAIFIHCSCCLLRGTDMTQEQHKDQNRDKDEQPSRSAAIIHCFCCFLGEPERSLILSLILILIHILILILVFVFLLTFIHCVCCLLRETEHISHGGLLHRFDVGRRGGLEHSSVVMDGFLRILCLLDKGEDRCKDKERGKGTDQDTVRC